MEGFEIVLKNERQVSYTRIRYSVELLDIAFFIAYIILEKYPTMKWWAIIYLLAGIVGFEWSLQRKAQKQTTIIAITYGLLIIAWFMINGWLALLHILLLILNLIAIRELHVLISNTGIVYPSFPAQYIQWDELQNVIVKDGILTIDFKNDKLLQADIDSATMLDEVLFNQYCARQLK